MSGSFTPGPWVWGDWIIRDEDRAAQRRGEPFWTLVAPLYGDGDTLTRGPFGRKAKDCGQIVWGTGWEVEGIDASDADRALIAAAPDMHAALAHIVVSGPDSDGLLWLSFSEVGGGRKGAVSVKADSLCGQALACWREARDAALENSVPKVR